MNFKSLIKSFYIIQILLYTTHYNCTNTSIVSNQSFPEPTLPKNFYQYVSKTDMQDLRTALKNERRFRTKYQDIDIPPFYHVPRTYHFNSAAYTSKAMCDVNDDTRGAFVHAQNTITNFLYRETPSSSTHSLNPVIFINLHERDGALLHECGHHEFTNNIGNPYSFNTMNHIFAPFIFYFWGIHKNKPYKNLFSKYSSKITAALSIPMITRIIWRRHEEKYADSFACQKAKDKQTLEESIKFFQKVQNPYHKTWPKNSSNFFKRLEHFTDDMYHPYPEDRMHIIQQAITTRFPK